MSEAPKAKALQPVSPGMYRHYMGRLYEVLHIARDSDVDETIVVYRSDEGQVWARPLPMFAGVAINDGQEVRRFERVGDEVPPDDSAIVSALRPMTSKLPWQVAELIRNHSQQRRQLADVTAKCAQLHERRAQAEDESRALHQLLARCHGMLGYLADMHPLSPREAQEVSDLRAALVADPAIGKLIAQPSTDDRLALMQRAIEWCLQHAATHGKHWSNERQAFGPGITDQGGRRLDVPAEFAEIIKVTP